jgi:hypothetical protein
MTRSETTSVVTAVKEESVNQVSTRRVDMRQLDLLEELVELQIVPEVRVSVAVRHDIEVSMTVCGSINTLRRTAWGYHR